MGSQRVGCDRATSMSMSVVTEALPLALWSVSSISYFLSLDGSSIHAVITAPRSLDIARCSLGGSRVGKSLLLRSPGLKERLREMEGRDGEETPASLDPCVDCRLVP